MIPILCTLFDQAYLAKGLAFIRSLQRHQGNFLLFVLALDDVTYQTVKAVRDPCVVSLALYVVEGEGDSLPKAKANRSWTEYCWTLAPYFTRKVLWDFDVPHVAYMDADSYLFAPLDALYREIADASIAIIPHRFPKEHQWRAKHNGVYNVNFVYFRKKFGEECLDRWTRQSLGWCYQRTEHAADGSLLFGDQAYLDGWVEIYGAHVVQHKGANLAPWNVQQYTYAFENRLYVIEHESGEPDPENKIVRIDPLLFYHFHGWTNWSARGGYPLVNAVIEHAYRPYEDEIANIYKEFAIAG